MYLKDFYCLKCGRRYPVSALRGRCDNCAGLLIADYYYDKISAYLRKEDLLPRASTIWRYKEVLPPADESNIVSKGEGMTPILALKKTGRDSRLQRLFMKDESTMPCQTFKSRSASISVSAAREAGLGKIVACAGPVESFSWACYASAAGIDAVFLCPEQEMQPRLAQAISSTGASLYLYSGSLTEAEKLAQRSAEKYGWFHASHLFNAYRLEGKKTLAFEIAESFEWKLPDVIICPAGRDGAFGGIYHGIRDLQRLGWIDLNLPRLVAVHEQGASGLFETWAARRKDVSAPAVNDHTAPLNIDEKVLFENQITGLVLDGIYKSLGCAVELDSQEIRLARLELAAKEGIIASDGGAAALAAAKRLAAENWLQSSETVLLLNPESGLDLNPPTEKLSSLIIDTGTSFLPEN